MYKFARLRALLRSLSVGPSARRQARMRKVWLILLGFGVTICFALALVFRTSHDWPITWRDIAARDEAARSFLLSCLVSLASGLYTVIAFAFIFRGASSRMLPPPAVAPALLNALRARDPRVVSVEQAERPAQGSGAEGANAPTATTFKVAAPELLTRPLALVLAALAAGMLTLAFIAFDLWTTLSILGQPIDPFDPVSNADIVYSTAQDTGIFAPLALLALVAAWRFWIRWRARARGAEVAASAEGLTIRDQETLWRRRFIAWRDVVSLARFTYNDAYVRPRTVYLLDAGDQTFLWESPADMRYEAPARRARIAEQQASAARLLAHVATVTDLPLLNVSSVISVVAKIDPDPNSMSDEPDPGDTALLDYLDGLTTAKPPLVVTPTPTQSGT